ncbi:hypothetical protein LIER_17048 [Lithospermum erythrorhizon]|uniref:Uncharacterized protein n=1 Tax=Lithospermum erythrorhizon TaxID=34254 RepID=A0AAV3QC52_LITER
MGTLKLNNMAKLKYLEDVKLTLCDDNYKVMIREYKLVELLYQLEKSAIQIPNQHWLATKGSLKWVEDNSVIGEIPAASVPELIDEDNTPCFLTSAFKKIGTRLDAVEKRVVNME